MLTKLPGLRHPRVPCVPPPTKFHERLLLKACSSDSAVSAAPVVDLGGAPAASGDADAPLLLRLHERCTATDQPFSWPAARNGTGEGRGEQRRALETASAASASRWDFEPLQSPESCQAHSGSGAIDNFSTGAAAGSGAGVVSASRDGALGSATPRQQVAAVGSGSLTEASNTELDVHCSETHPGSMCCTTTLVEKDATANSCAVTLRTTVRLTDARLHVAPAELEELAWLAARDAASEAVSALNRRSSLSAGRQERHQAVCTMLQRGTIRDAKRMENGFGHVSYLLTLEDKSTGRRMRAAFKPRVEGDCEGWHRVPIEVAAYQLNLLLGMDVVPPAVMRTDCDVDWTHYPAGGAFIYWCSNARQLNAVPMADWSVPAAVLLSDTRILDVLIQNSDRHAGHFLYAEHWADGDYTPQPQPSTGGGGGGSPQAVWRGCMSPVLIDHAAGFRQDAFVCLDHENAFLTGPTRHISARTYLRLRFLDAPSLRGALNGTITDEEVAALLSRRDAVLSFFDNLVVEHGYDSVVLEA